MIAAIYARKSTDVWWELTRWWRWVDWPAVSSLATLAAVMVAAHTDILGVEAARENL